MAAGIAMQGCASLGHSDLPYIVRPGEGRWNLGWGAERIPSDEPATGYVPTASALEVGRWWPLGHGMDLYTRAAPGVSILTSTRKAVSETERTTLGVTWKVGAAYLPDIGGFDGAIHSGNAYLLDFGPGFFVGYNGEEGWMWAEQGTPQTAKWTQASQVKRSPSGYSLSVRLFERMLWGEKIDRAIGGRLNRTLLEVAVGVTWSNRGRTSPAIELGLTLPLDGKKPASRYWNQPEEHPQIGLRLGVGWTWSDPFIVPPAHQRVAPLDR